MTFQLLRSHRPDRDDVMPPTWCGPEIVRRSRRRPRTGGVRAQMGFHLSRMHPHTEHFHLLIGAPARYSRPPSPRVTRSPVRNQRTGPSP